MSSTAKKIALILGAMVILLMGFSVITFMEKQQLTEMNAGLQNNLAKEKNTVSQKLAEIQQLKSAIKKNEEEISRQARDLTKAKRLADDLMNEIDKVRKEKDAYKNESDKYKARVDDIRNERDGLMSRIRTLETRNRTLENDLASARSQQENLPDKPGSQSPSRSSATGMAAGMPDDQDEAYWAQLLKDKASLEIEIANLKEELSGNSLEVIELTQKNSELEIELDTIAHEKEELQRDMAHQEGLINNLSLELARAKNDKKFISDRSEKLTEENRELRGQLKMLASTKGALEKSIVRLTQDKSKIESQLGQSEVIVQSKIDEIWDIKESLDKVLKKSSSQTSSNDIELSPIVVSSNGQGVDFDSGMAPVGLNGKVLSINEDNNFLIVNIGESSGLRVGDKLSVYRDSKYLASLEVIQVRNDIAAADIKDQWTKIQVGDLVQ